MKNSTILVSEIFKTIQGEGALIGKPTIFVRTGGCDYRCARCDTLYAVLPEHRAEWQAMTASEIFAQIQTLSGKKPLLITLSGGNPAIHPLESLILLGKEQKYSFALETQASIAQPWFADLDYLTLSPKAPGMGNPWHTNWERLARCIEMAQAKEKGNQPVIVFKIVVFSDEDYLYAKDVAGLYPDIPMYLQVGNHTPPHLSGKLDLAGILQRLDWLIERTLQDQWYTATVLPQMHTLLWGNLRGK